jgi:Mg2+ and Co2+ transporter CorA
VQQRTCARAQEDTQEELDRKRNALFALQLLVTLVTMAFSFVSMVGGIFGMNLWANIGQPGPGAFTITTLGSTGLALGVTIVIVFYLRSRRMLYVGS